MADGSPLSPAALMVARAAFAALAPPPEFKPSEWAESAGGVRIPVGAAISGPIRFDNAPYQREPLDMTVDPSCHRITLKWGAQVGKTQLALCAQAYKIVHDPINQIMMQASESDLHKWLNTKFNPLVESSPALSERIAPPRSRKGVNNTKMKSYPGGDLIFAWAGSPKTMRGISAPFIVCDETDGYDRTAEGHPVSLLWQRARSFLRHMPDQVCLLEISTPTVRGASHIDAAYEEGDQRQFHVGCPQCGAAQVLGWSQVKWDKASDGTHLPETACYECSANGCVWDDDDRIGAIRAAEASGHGWIARKAVSRTCLLSPE